jgi:hypothetical protein
MDDDARSREGPAWILLTVVLAAGMWGALAAPAPALDLAVRISTPASSVAGAPCRVKVSVSRAVSAAVLLQERSGRHWRTVARKRLTRRSMTLRCPAARAARTRRFRAVVRRGDRILARSPVVVTRVTPRPVAVQPPAPQPPTPVPPPGRRPLDPAQFGVEGTGGPPSPETVALLGNSRVAFNAVGVADLQAGRIDPRIVAVLTKLAETHALTVGAMCSDHPKFTSGGSVSMHYLGRGVDIAAIDGVPVSPSNLTARMVAGDLSTFEAAYRPDEIGSPFVIAGPGYFSDSSTQDNIHIAFKQPIDPSWTPPVT